MTAKKKKEPQATMPTTCMYAEEWVWFEERQNPVEGYDIEKYGNAIGLWSKEGQFLCQMRPEGVARILNRRKLVVEDVDLSIDPLCCNPILFCDKQEADKCAYYKPQIV